MAERCLLPALLWVALAMNACAPRPADEEIILAHLNEMTRALAERETRAFMRPIAEDFTGITWDLDRQAAMQLLRREMLIRQQIRVHLVNVDVELRGDDRAVAVFHAILIGGSGRIPEEGRWFRVESGWRRAGRDWELISAEWEQVAGHARTR